MNILFVLCLSLFIVVKGQHDHKVNVTVYYESLCPDSIEFFTKQLYPALQVPELNQHINLTLVPYGKSNMTNDGTSVEFSCHHGAAECLGNKIHACALAKIPKGPDNQNRVAVDFINCVMANVDLKSVERKLPVKTCTEKTAGTNWADIDNCATSHEGNRLLEEQGRKTKRFQQYLEAVPFIVVNEKLHLKASEMARTDFVGAVCEYIGFDKPECSRKNGSENQAKSLGIGFLIILLTLRVF